MASLPACGTIFFIYDLPRSNFLDQRQPQWSPPSIGVGEGPISTKKPPEGQSLDFVWLARCLASSNRHKKSVDRRFFEAALAATALAVLLEGAPMVGSGRL